MSAGPQRQAGRIVPRTTPERTLRLTLDVLDGEIERFDRDKIEIAGATLVVALTASAPEAERADGPVAPRPPRGRGTFAAPRPMTVAPTAVPAPAPVLAIPVDAIAAATAAEPPESLLDTMFEEQEEDPDEGFVAWAPPRELEVYDTRRLVTQLRREQRGSLLKLAALAGLIGVLAVALVT